MALRATSTLLCAVIIIIGIVTPFSCNAVAVHSKLYPAGRVAAEIRSIAADDLWMSPCYKQPCVTIHFTWKQNWPEVRKLLPMIEEQLAPFNARPHWGKLFTISASRLKTLYEKLPDFQQLLKEYDPQGKFRNKFLDTHIYSS